MRRPSMMRLMAAGAVGALVTAALPAQAAHHDDDLETIVGLDGPRGVASVRNHKTLVAEADGTFSRVTERRHGPALVEELGAVDSGGFAPALDNGRGRRVYVVTGAGEPGVGNILYTWSPKLGEPKAVADIGAYQETDPDPYDLENVPADSNAFGVAALGNSSVLVSDAAGNDLLKVKLNGDIRTVARIKPRVVAVPEGLPETDPEGNPLPPAGTMIPAEAVATSVTKGADGYYYVGELRGFPATPGTSEIWRIEPNAHNAVCDPEHPYRGACQRFADGLTSIVDLAADRWGNIYALSLSKQSWLAFELGVPGSEIGALYKLGPNGHIKAELAADELVSPGGVDVSRHGRVLVTGPVFGPGALSVVD